MSAEVRGGTADGSGVDSLGAGARATGATVDDGTGSTFGHCPCALDLVIATTMHAPLSNDEPAIFFTAIRLGRTNMRLAEPRGAETGVSPGGPTGIGGS